MVEVYSAEEFYANYYMDLLKCEAIHQLIIGNLKACLHEPHEEALFAVIQKEDNQYFACHYPPYSIVVTKAEENANVEIEKQVGEELATYLQEHSLVTRGINAPCSIAQGFVEWQTRHSKSMKLDVDMDIMELTQVKDCRKIGELEEASIEDLEKLGLMYVNFTVEALGDAAQIERVHERLTQYIEKKVLYVLRLEGKIAAMCAIPRKLEHGYSISAVYTLPKYRGKGLCKSMIAQLCSKMLKEGSQFLCLYVDRSNPFSNAAYEAVGFKVVGNSTSYEFSKE